MKARNKESGGAEKLWRVALLKGNRRDGGG